MKTNKFFLNKLFITSLTLLIFCSIICSFLPLTNIIGYEYSVVQSILLSLFSGLIVVSYCKKEKCCISFKHVLKSNRNSFIIYIVIPFIISVLSSILFQVCPIWEGMLFYILFVPPAMLIGISTGFIAANISNRFAFSIFVLIYILILFYPLYEIYARPQVYLYHEILGFFPGTIYDDDIPLDFKLVSFRLLSMLPFILSVTALSFLKNNKSRVFASSLILVLTYTFFQLIKPVLNYSTTVSNLENELRGKVITEHFIITYPESTEPGLIKIIALSHEYYFKKLSEETGLRPEEKIRSFVFKNNDQKRVLFGAGNADVAKPWLNQIYTEIESYNTSLLHEIAHVFSAEIGSTFLKLADNWNPALIEGFAMALENDYAEYDIDYLAYSAEKSGYNFPINSLFSGFNFLTGTSSVSYIYAGSFIKYLIKEYGFEKVSSLYGSLDFFSIYGMQLDTLESGYYKYLNALGFKENKQTAQMFFGRLSLFTRTCPRITADKLKEAWEHFNSGAYILADKLFLETYNYSGAPSSLFGSLQAKEKLKDYHGAYNLVSSEYKKFENSSYKYSLQVKYADLAWLVDNKNITDSLYKDLSTNPPNEYYKDIADSRLDLFENHGNYANEYITGNSNQRFYILKQISDSSNSHFNLSLLINLTDNVGLTFEFTDKIIHDLIDINNDFNYSSYTLNMISSFYFRNGHWKNSEYYGQLALEKAERMRFAVYSEESVKVKWFVNYGDSVVNTFSWKVEEIEK